MQQSTCSVFSPITVDDYVSFFNYTPVGGASDSTMAPTYSCSFLLVGTGASCSLLGPPGFRLKIFFLLQIFSGTFQGSPIVGQFISSVSLRF